jgi:hypothetical protein
MAYEVAGFKAGTPVDKDGQPLVKVTFSVQELIPTGKFANVTVGPATAERYVPANLEEKELANAISELAKPVEWALGHRRDQILNEIANPQGADDGGDQ